MKIITAKAKDLKETIENMDAEHKSCIAELEAKAPGTPSEEREEKAQAHRAFSATIAKQLEDAQKLLDETTNAWTVMNANEDLVNVHEAIHKTQQEMDTVATAMKDLPPIQRMMKMGETKKLQNQMHMLRKDEAHYLKIVQPWKMKFPRLSFK